jgi:hypothetical protein
MRGYKSAVKRGYPGQCLRSRGWDVAACEAVHADWHLIVHDGEWKPVKLADFWHHHLSRERCHDDLTLWKFPLSLAKAERHRHKSVRVIAKAIDDLDLHDLD